MPAILKVSLRGGIDFIIPDRKLAVVEDPFFAVHAVPDRDLVDVQVLDGLDLDPGQLLDLIGQQELYGGIRVPPAAWTIAAKPSACLDRIS